MSELNEIKQLVTELAEISNEIDKWFIEREEYGFSHYEAYFMYECFIPTMQFNITKLAELLGIGQE